MKKLISLLLRLILAAAGIGYIIWTLSWHDQVVVPAGYPFADGTRAGQEVALRVVSEESDGGLTLAGPVQGERVRVFKDELGTTAQTPRFKPGTLSTLSGANVWMLLGGLALILPVFPIQAFRWWRLMRCRGMEVPFARAMRLTMVGLFFNFCMPGMTGGDVVKAYYAAKGSGARGVAVMSVIFDRVTGLVGLVMLAGIAGLVMLWRGGLEAEVHDLVRTITAMIWLGFACVVVGTLVYFSQRVRRLIGLDKLFVRLGPEHILVRIDDTAAAYRDHPGTIVSAALVSLPVHLCQAMATTLAGWALGMGLAAGLMLTVLPVVFLAGSVPLTYQGLGVMEYLAKQMLLPSPLADANQLISMLVLMRLYLITYALIGALLMLRGDIHLFPQKEDDPESVSSHVPA